MRLFIVIALLAAGCSTVPGVRLEENSDALGTSGPRWGVLSLYSSEFQHKARAMMEQYCASTRFRVTSVEKHTVGSHGNAQTLSNGTTIGRSNAVSRTYIKFECESFN